MISPPSGYKLLREGTSNATDWSEILGAPNGCWMDEYNRRRVLLWRTFDGPDGALAPLAFGMMNPSYATHERVDNTVTRCIGYGKRERAGGLIVVNMAPYIATYQDELERAFRGGVDVLDGSANLIAWQVAALLASKLVAAWGSPKGSWWKAAKLNGNTLLQPFGDRIFTIGAVAKSGEPKHPLRLRADEPFLPLTLSITNA